MIIYVHIQQDCLQVICYAREDIMNTKEINNKYTRLKNV